MKQVLPLTIILLVLAACTSNLKAPIEGSATEPDTVGTAMPEEPSWNLYDPDPDHIWNRVFRLFYERTDQNGTKYGLGELDPLLWFDTTYLLSGPSHQQALAVLDEYLKTDAQNLIRDPLKRAMFQRDLWAVFDWLASQSEPYPAEREALQSRLTQIIKRVALTPAEIESLPDNYVLTSQSGAFPTSFQVHDPKIAFLPSDISRPGSGWVPIGREGGPIAWAHTQGFPFLGRSVFLVFVRSPKDKTATLDLVQSLGTDPVLAAGSEVALVRRMLLIDNQGRLRLSPLVETVQIRHFSPQQFFYQFELDRARLLKERSDTLSLNMSVFPLFASHGDPFERRDLPELEVAIPDLCQGCHFDDPAITSLGNMQSVISYSRFNFPLPNNQRPIISPTNWEKEAESVLRWKINHQSWQTLLDLWHQ